MSPREIQRRNAKAENLRVLQAEDGTFYVESEKGKILYNVILDDQQTNCTCGDFAKNSKRALYRKRAVQRVEVLMPLCIK